jgi:hypothetical protein
MSALGLVLVLGTSNFTSAQGHSNNDNKQEQKAEKQRQKTEKERAKADQQRQNDWEHRNTQIKNGNDRSNGAGYYNGNANANSNRNHDRYRVYRNGSYYNTDQRGADLLRQAVNEGYRQGFAAGRRDRDNRRNSSWSSSSVYRSGSVGYQSYVTRSQYQYYFQQGFQRGYQDGSSVRYQNDYNGNYQYGYSNNGVLTVIGAILDSVLRISSY